RAGTEGFFGMRFGVRLRARGGGRSFMRRTGGLTFSLFCMLLAVAAAPGIPAFAQAAPIAEVADFTLANGLEVVVVPDHRAPVVTHMVWYRVGCADQTPAKAGLARCVEHRSV